VRRILRYYADAGDALQMRKIFVLQVGPACTGNASRPASQR
jgi:hypothetical protein